MTFVELPLSKETTSGTDNTMAPSGGGAENTQTNLSYCEQLFQKNNLFFFGVINILPLVPAVSDQSDKYT